MTAPERIWATEDAENFGEDRFHATKPMKGLTEYVRADLVPDPNAIVRAALEAAAAKLHWLWNADGTVMERRVSSESAEEILAIANDPEQVAAIVRTASSTIMIRD